MPTDEDFVKVLNLAHKEAKKQGLGKGRGGLFTFECPVCNGRITASVASLNGHIHGLCNTQDCVKWME